MSDNIFKKLILDRRGEVTTITFNRPDVHNALDREASQELNDAVRQVRGDRECRILILRGAGDTFCSGDDVREFNDWGPDDPYWQVAMYQETAQMIEDLTPVTIAAVDGVCTGGGLELTLVCDFVIATRRSRWGMPEIDWDITPGWGGTSRLGRFAGRRKAKEWNLIGNLFTGVVAERYNLVNRLVDSPAELTEQVEALIEVMLAKEAFSTRRTKKYLDKGAELHISGALAFEAEATPRTLGQGIADFTDREARSRRRKLSQDFWKD